MSSKRRSGGTPRLIAAAATLTFLLVLPSSAFGQATRTWVSGVGDDVNPCSRTAPCKTWAGATSKTAAGGEINALDPGGFGAVTITKSLTLDGNGTHASILACSTSGIIINAPSTAKVTLRDLSINGCRNTSIPGTNGIRILSAGVVTVTKTRIFGFGTSGTHSGITAENNHANARLSIRDSDIHNNFRGLRLSPGPSGVIRATVQRTDFGDNTQEGVLLDSAAGVASSVTANIFRSSMNDNGPDSGTGVGLRIVKGQGILARAAISAVEISGNKIGVALGAGAQLLSRGNNDVFDNSVSDGDNPTGSINPK